MPLPHYHGGIKHQLNEEKYLNERRRLILENLSGEIDYVILEDMKKDFMEKVNSLDFEPRYKN